MQTIISENRSAKMVLAKYEKSYDNSIAILLNSKKGLKPQAVFDLMALTQFTQQLIEMVLSKTIKTFTNYKQQNITLDAAVSEKVLKLFALYDKGIEVFGSASEFNKWMAEPAFGIGNQVPRDLLDTVTGIDMVEEELIRIEYGDLA